MSYLLIHNGNQLVKPWAASFFDCTPLPCFADNWIFNHAIIKSNHEKINLLQSGNYCTDIMASEGLDMLLDVLKDIRNIKIIKILTAFDDDIVHLDPAWNLEKYDHLQWITNSFFGLSVSDRIINWHTYASLSTENHKDHILFTPGRSGTHILKSLLNIPNLHHNDDMLASSKFSDLLLYQHISTVLRKNFHEQALSDLIAEKYGIVITTKNNLVDVQHNIKSWQPVFFDESDAERSWKKIITFIDLFLGLKTMYNKEINLYLMEDLKPYYHQIPFLKNPYDKKQIIANYEKSMEICKKYQSRYDDLVMRLIDIIGLTIYHP